MTGASGSGKSDLALRMILEKGAVLIADDRTDIRRGQTRPVASCPETIKGLLEVRGVGLSPSGNKLKQKSFLLRNWFPPLAEIERLPAPETTLICGYPVKKIKLYPFELSAAHKLTLACDEKSEAG